MGKGKKNAKKANSILNLVGLKRKALMREKKILTDH